jgi:hypothetical protein
MAETLDVTSMLPNKFEPKQKRRWIMQIEGVDAFLLKTAQRPTIATEAIEIPFMNSRRYVAGPSKFNPISITLHDPIAPSGAQQVMEWIRTCYESVSGRAGYADFYKRDIALKLVDPVGTVVEFWDIIGAFILESNFGDLSYADGELNEISLSISIDNAVLQF